MTNGDSDNQRETRVARCADELVGSVAVDIDVVAVAGAAGDEAGSGCA